MIDYNLNFVYRFLISNKQANFYENIFKHFKLPFHFDDHFLKNILLFLYLYLVSFSFENFKYDL